MSVRQVISLCLCMAGLAAAEPVTLPLQTRPEWLRRDGIVMAGSWETLMMRARIFGDNGDFTPTAEQRAAYEREHSPQMIARLKDMGVNFVMIHGYRGAGMEAEKDSLADAVRFAKRYHDAGLRVGVYSDSGTFFWELLSKEAPQSKDWLVLDARGKPKTYGRQTYRYYWNRNHPDAQAYYRRVVRFSVEEIGADLIHLDNYVVGPGHDEKSVERFRRYLSETFGSKRLEEVGIAVPHSVQPPTSDSPDLLRWAWLDFSCQSLADSYHEMSRYARTLRKEILMEINPAGVRDRILSPIDHGRLLQGGEACWDESSAPGLEDGRLRSRIRTYKAARRMGNIVFAYADTPLAMAESMAFNLDCLGCICWYEYGEIVSRPYSNEPMSADLAPFIRFFHKRRDLLREAEVVADVAVLRSFPSQTFADPKHAQLTGRVEEKLIENCGCFQIIYDHHLDDLQRYRALILAGCVALSDRQVELIERYVASGGRLCVIGPAATHDEWMRLRRGSAFANLPSSSVVRIDQNGGILQAIRRACDSKLSLSVAAELGTRKSAAPVVAVGKRIYTDRRYTITRLPKELAGLGTIRLSAERTKRDSSLRFRASVPVRVFVGFAPRGFSAQWLDPQPGWKLYAPAGLHSTLSQIGQGMDIHCHDFEAGDVRLFENKKGTYVLLGIQAQSPEFTEAPFTAETRTDGPLGLRAELTKQPGRRLVHLVNYRSDYPLEDVAIRLRLPPGQHAKAVTLASPEREKDMVVPFQQQSDVVTFSVPEVSVYEIAIVR